MISEIDRVCRVLTAACKGTIFANFVDEIANIEVDLFRVRAARVSLLNSTDGHRAGSAVPNGPERAARMLKRVSAQLVKLDRYEDRALGRRKTLLRKFDSLAREEG
jgi:hypothetical protein